jgi:hypothetical protein
MSVPADASSSYLSYLPALFQEAEAAETTSQIGRFLLAFEHLLTGLGDIDHPGLEEILDGLTEREPLPGQPPRRLVGVERYFDPGVRTPGPDTDAQGFLPLTECVPDREFLDWLAGWVALVPRPDVGDDIVRQLIARAVPLYAKRGTKAGIEEILSLYGLAARIEEPTGWLQVGVASSVGVDTRIDGPPPHYFSVVLVLAPGTSNDEQARQLDLLRAIVDAEKPAHTYYDYPPEIILPEQFEVGVHSTIGIDTILG